MCIIRPLTAAERKEFEKQWDAKYMASTTAEQRKAQSDQEHMRSRAGGQGKRIK